MEDRTERLLQNPSFVQELFNQETDAKAQAFLAQNGVELSLGELAILKQVYQKGYDSMQEMSDRELEQIAGGVSPELVSRVGTLMGKMWL